MCASAHVAHTEKKTSFRIIVPGYRFLGPGNSIPVDAREYLDSIALRHDITYVEGSSSREVSIHDVFTAVRFFVVACWAFLSGVLLLAKACIESVLKTQFYPVQHFRLMDLVYGVLLLFALSWLLLLEMRLYEDFHRYKHECLRRSSNSWALLRCFSESSSGQ